MFGDTLFENLCFSFTAYFAVYYVALFYQLPAVIAESRKWTKYVPRRTVAPEPRKFNTEKLEKARIVVDHTSMTKTYYEVVSFFITHYELSLIRGDMATDTSHNQYASKQETQHLRIHNILNKCFVEDQKVFAIYNKYGKMWQKYFWGNKLVGCGSYMSEVGFFFRGARKIDFVASQAKHPRMERVIAWHLFEELEHGFDYGVPLISIPSAAVRFLCTLICLFNYRCIWLVMIEVPATLWCILSSKPQSFFRLFYEGIYQTAIKESWNDAHSLVAVTRGMFPSWEQRAEIEKELKDTYVKKYGLDLDGLVEF